MAAQSESFPNLDYNGLKEFSSRVHEICTHCRHDHEFSKSLPSTRRERLDPEKPTCGHELKQQPLRAFMKKWMALTIIFLIIFGIMGGFFCGGLSKITGVNMRGIEKRDEATLLGKIGFKGYIDGEYFEGYGPLNEIMAQFEALHPGFKHNYSAPNLIPGHGTKALQARQGTTEGQGLFCDPVPGQDFPPVWAPTLHQVISDMHYYDGITCNYPVDQCAGAFCEQGTMIKVCAPPGPPLELSCGGIIADMAQAISDACLGPWQWGEYGGGQQFNSLGFNVVVLAEDCGPGFV